MIYIKKALYIFLLFPFHCGGRLIFNDSASVIWVHWTHDNLVDSIEITPNGIAELFVTQHGIEQCRKGPFFRDVNQDLQEIEVRLNDSITSEKNYLLNEYLEGDIGFAVK